MLRRAIVATAFAGLLAASACDATAPGGTSPGDAISSGISGSATPSPSITVHPDIKGIVVISCRQFSGPREVRGYDPTSSNGAHELRQFSSDMETGVACVDGISELALRQTFNRDYSRMVAQTSKGADGSQQIGFLTPGGEFTSLTPANSGFSELPSHRRPLFAPKSGRIWFIADDGFASVDPNTGASSLRNEVKEYANHGYHLRPNDKPSIHDAYGIAPTVYSADGKLMVAYGSYSGLLRTTVGSKNAKYTPWPQEADNCRPAHMIDNNRVLCIGITGLSESGNSLYLMTFQNNGRQMTQQKLTPDTKRQIFDTVASPDGTTIAFLAGLGNERGLYTMPIAGGEPKMLAGLPVTTTAGQVEERYFLAEWVN